ncbi:hypothetical protein [Marinirhabdus gelatinilytica]|uniref:Secreted protein (Por secretion system target) n=1 Tax=Marinirhabdus gelatinilytica TaxID=1703343 RepID=A0A370QGT4_9FLAO|nr:hypothetical protein [Marinirhabdus gelatinilytica]RDK87300.1 hypothetical protein C8D94_102487 [Marinirhabdus gelatinilytica]
MKKLVLAFFFLSVSLSGIAQENLNVMFYNLLEFPSASPGNRFIILRDIVAEFPPDIFMICELESEAGADTLLNETLNFETLSFNRAPYLTNQSSTSPLQQMLYYRRDKFTLENTSTILTSVRDINKYELKLNTVNGATDPVVLYLYVAHLKSSDGASNEAIRLDMVNEFTNDLLSLPPDAFVVFAGDLNLYDSNEPAYIELLDNTNPIVLKDPIDTPGNWHNNDTFQATHTQSTREDAGTFGAGAGGGMDDRFDFILLSENMLTNPKLQYVENTYKAFGNNGNCYDLSISNENCTGEFGQIIRNRLFSMSDHLPVVLQLQTDQEIVLGNTQFATPGPLLSLKSTVVSKQLEIHSTAPLDAGFSFAIYNTLGQKVLQWDGNPAQEIIVPIAALANGVYYIKTNLPTIETLKFLKNS